MSAALLAYILGINVAAYAAFVMDKAKAVAGVRRIPERSLLMLALFGGAPGAVVAQQMIRHKTRKEPFRTLLMGTLFINAFVLAVILLVGGDRLRALAVLLFQ